MTVRSIVYWLVLLLSTGCALNRTPTQTSRSATEQLLLSQAIERSLNDLVIPLAAGASVTIEAAGFAVPPINVGASSDLTYAHDAIAERLGQLGYYIRPKAEEATYLARVLVQSLGTVQGLTFFGMPPVQSVLIPFALPELTLYKHQAQSGYMRFSIAMYEMSTGRFLFSTPWYSGSTFFDQYTFFFLFTYNSTDLNSPP